MPVPSSFDYAVIRVVPRVEREEFINAGVILFCRTRRFLGARLALDWGRLAALDAELNPVEVEEHLALIPLLCSGDPAAGPLAALPQADRFHWLVAPRSSVIQCSPVHTGLSADPRATLEHLLETIVCHPESKTSQVGQNVISNLVRGEKSP